MAYASYNARKPDCRPGARTCSALLRVGTSRCDVPARVQRAERLATNPRSAPARRGDAAARRPYLAKQKPVPPPGATRHRQLVDARRATRPSRSATRRTEQNDEPSESKPCLLRAAV